LPPNVDEIKYAMKKINSFLFLLLTVNVALTASPRRGYHGYFPSHDQVVRGLLSKQCTDAVKAVDRTTSTVIGERVIAQSRRDSVTGPLSDSVNIRYTGLRRSTYDYNDMIYPYNYTYSTTPMFNFRGVFTAPQVQADTYMHWNQNPYTLAWGKYEWAYASYDTGNNQLTYEHLYTDSALNANTSYVNAYTGHQILRGSWFASVGGVMDSAYQQFFQYNTLGQLSKDSILELHGGTWHIVGRTFYSYTVAGDLSEIDCFAQTDTTYDSTLLEQAQYSNTWDGSHRLLTVTTSLYNNVALLPSDIDTFAYTGASTFHTAWREYQYDNINHYWAPMFNMTKTLNSLNLPDTIKTMGYDSVLMAWVPQMMQTCSYDSWNNPDTLNEYDYNFTSFPASPDFTTVYYYQPIDSIPTETRAVAMKSCIQVYPVPAHNQINISGLVVGQRYEISVIDDAGRLLLRSYVPSAATSNALSLEAFATGTYTLVVGQADGSVMTSRFTKL